jgi:hypothetical protein
MKSNNSQTIIRKSKQLRGVSNQMTPPVMQQKQRWKQTREIFSEIISDRNGGTNCPLRSSQLFSVHFDAELIKGGNAQ